jgi:tetratricopeptide (TPR) repeat protein
VLRRWIFGLLIAALPCAAQLRERQEAPVELPANMQDEDEGVPKQTEYAFNPIQARKEFTIGDFYARRGNHRGAAGRSLEATRWDPNYAEAFWKLGRSRQELDEPEEAAKAYQRYLELDPQGKQSKDARKRLAEMEKAELEKKAKPSDSAGKLDSEVASPAAPDAPQ